MKLLLAAGLLLVTTQEPVDPNARVSALCRSLEIELDPKAVDKLFTEALPLVQAADLTPEARARFRDDVADALRIRRDRHLASIEARAEPLLARPREIKAELNRRREAAHRLIADPKAYLREEDPGYRKVDPANGQAAVDKLVLKAHGGSVEELWTSPALPGPDPVLKAELDWVLESHGRHLERLGEKPVEADGQFPAELAHHLSVPLDARGLCLDARELEAWAWNRAVDRYNEALADVDVAAKDHARVINEYREMMGRRRLFLDARLCRSSQKHSAACNAAQKIWHAGPDGDPQTRARLEGFPNPVSENVGIAFAHPAEIWWRGWFRASDHHRNALSDGWTCLGYAYVGNVGTQTFASFPPPKGLR
jgi:hypothetical protein